MKKLLFASFISGFLKAFSAGQESEQKLQNSRYEGRSLNMQRRFRIYSRDHLYFLVDVAPQFWREIGNYQQKIRRLSRKSYFKSAAISYPIRPIKMKIGGRQ